MTDKTFLKRAVELATQSAEPVQCGCVLVQDGEILAETYNSQRADQRILSHAELKAVTEVNRKLGRANLSGVIAYCSCEPCIMCLTALCLARVDRIVYGRTMKEVSGGMPMGELDSQEFAERYLNFVPKLEHLLL